MPVTLTDPCLDVTVTQPVPEPQTYTITDPGFDYDLTPQFSVVPAICDTTLELTDPADPTTTYPGTTLDDDG